MKNKILLTAAGLACTLCSVSCIREGMMDEIYRPEGTEIIFAAANTYESEEAQTRVDFFGPDSLFFDTAASGEVEAETRTIFTNKGSSTVERIDWLNGDSMSIQYRRGSIQNGVYGVTKRAGGETDSSTKDIADVSHVSGTTLYWQGGSGAHKFYARYPEGTLSTDADGPMITGSIPTAQTVTWRSDQKKYLPDMNNCYMVGYKEISPSDPNYRVSIDFVPAVTMFEFNLKRATSGTTYVRSATLSGTNIAGSFSFQLKGGSNPRSDWVKNVTAGSGGSITVTFSGGDKKMTQSEALNFTILANPISYSSVRLYLEMSTDGSTYFTKHVDLNGGGGGFAACKKHVITNSKVPNDTWTYELVHTGTTQSSGGYVYQEIVRSTRDGGNTSSAPFNSYYTKQGSSTQNAASVTVQYAADNNGVPGTFYDSASSVTDLNSATVSGGVSKTILANVAANSNPVQDGTGVDVTTIHSAKLKANGSYGTSSAPKDLSKCEITSSGVADRSGGKPTTANCYVVDRPGYYMFPLVYGNAIDYTRSGNTRGIVSAAYSGFKNYSDADISSPYILDDVSLGTSDVEAACVWQDGISSSSDAYIKNLSVISVSSSNLFGAVSSGYKSSVPYIKFEVDSNKIRQGNAVVCIRKKNKGDILWSWHIWVTDGYDTNGDGSGDSFAPMRMSTRSSVVTYNDFFPIIMGWYDAGTATTYKDRAWWVKVTQTPDSGHSTASEKTLYFKVIQRSGAGAIAPDISTGTFYQWGRKDPFLPATSSGSNKAAYAADDYSSISKSSSTKSYGTAIKNPYYFYGSDAGGWTSSTFSYKLWNSDNNNSSDTKVAKTVYDPCPPGYSVPSRDAYTLCTTDGTGHMSYQYSYFNVVDTSGNGSKDANDYKHGNVWGWYYYTTGTGTGTPGLYMPSCGYRKGGSYLLTSDASFGEATGSYWTAHSNTSGHGSALDVNKGLVLIKSATPASRGFLVRAAREQ